MKKGILILLAITLIASLFATPVAAATTPQEINLSEDGVYYFEDGSYIVTTTPSDTEAVIQPRATYTVNRSKTATYYTKDNEPMCALKVTGTFSVNSGVSVQCTKVTATTYVYNDSWSVEDVTTSRTSGAATTASATASGNFVKRILLIIPTRVPVTVTVNCDKNGNS